MASPRAFLERKPTRQSVLFGGKYINLTHLASACGFTQSHLSFVFAGKRNPSVECAMAIAKALRMDVGDFLDVLARHKSAAA